MLSTKVFNNGNSQAIRIPREYRFEQDEVCINKVGSVIVVFPKKDRFAVLMESLEEFSSDFFKGGRHLQEKQQEREQLD